MKADEFHRTPIGAKVRACVGSAEHCAKVLHKDTKRRKFFLRFHLRSRDVREEWRSALRCYAVLDDRTPIGPVS
jgi:hypothetical protein